MEKTKSLISFLIQQSDEVTQYYHAQRRSDIMFFALSMIDRLNFSCYSLQRLIDSFDENTKHEFSCGLIIRAILLDYLILMNAVLLAQDKATLYKYCSEWLADSLRHAIDNINTLENDITDEAKKKMYQDIVNMNPEIFSLTSEIPVVTLSKPPKNKTLYAKLAGRSYDREAYSHYLYYSKYDHFGQMFYETSRQPFNSKLERIDKCMKYFLLSFYYSLFILDLDNSHVFIKSKKELTISFIEETKCL